ncbi:unnamed protein product [Rhodiola kirilowii]
MSLSRAGKVVCVTGPAGYIVSGLVKLLLLRGYTVKASVHDPNDPKKTQHLTALDGAKERLQLYKANLLEQGSFDPVVEGCEGVLHTASPFYHTVVDPQAELIDHAVKGTLNVLSSCAKVASLKRVILTSSIAAVAYSGKPRTPEVVVDETWCSNPDVCKEMKLWYVISKTLAEEAEWKFVKEKGIDMVNINPAMVIGPLLQPTLNTSAAAILNLVNGSETYPNVSFGWVNVKDVAETHILAFEGPSATCRYCLVERVAHSSEVVNMLHKLYPDIKLPTKCANDKLMEQLMAGADSTILGIIWIINKFGIFSSPRPPEVANLEDKVLSEGGSIVTNKEVHGNYGKGKRQRMASPKIPLTRIGYGSKHRGEEGKQGVTWTNRLTVY